MAVERFLPSAIAHFEPADLIGALTTGIVVLDSDLCVVYLLFRLISTRRHGEDKD